MSKNLVSRVWLALREKSPAPIAPPDTFDEAEVAGMLCELGMALIEVMQPTNLVRARLLGIGQRYTTKDVRVVALPTVLLVKVGSVGYEIDVTQRATAQLNLAGRVGDIARLAEAGAIAPVEAVANIVEARALPVRFHPVLIVLGYVVTTLGFSMIINPTRAAMAVTVLATWFVADAANDGLMRVTAPSLVAILPGLSLTVGAMEVAGSAILAGASRLISGIVQLMLMVFGVALGTALAGKVAPQQPSAQMGPWAFYAAILVIGVGLFIYLSAPRGSLVWLILAVAVALIGQKVGTLFLSPAHAGALGAALVLPFALLAARLKGAPAPLVMVLAAFWALVPGALSFESMSQAATGGPGDLPTLITAVTAVFSIALGTVVSWSVINAIAGRRDS